MGGGETRCLEMDLPELTKIISNRIQKLEPENALKIVGCLFLKEPSEQEIIQLAICPDNVLHSKITDAKCMLNAIASKTAVSSPVQAIPDSPYQFNAFPHAAYKLPYNLPLLASDQQPPTRDIDFIPHSYSDSVGDESSLRNQAHFLNLDDPVNHANAMGPNLSNSCYYHDALCSGALTSRTTRRSPSLPEFPIKACHYFYKGYCKHGTNCRYFHGQSLPDCYPQVFGPNMNELATEEHGFSPRSLQKLEVEITELLKSKSGPVSIASLPMLYYEKYGRNLQAEGYLTESQRHGKAGFSLTKLLARLKNRIRLIDRPHGQHCIVLAEDEPRYMASWNERNDMSPVSVSSHQIYLTFPAESTFNEEDVAQYFRQFGPVRDVRIPCQDKRMFGFVSFIYSETVTLVLSKRNPHYICNARVLVKPYREKSRITDRAYMERVKPAIYLSSHFLDIDPELQSFQRDSESCRLLEEQEKMIELERRLVSEFSIEPKPLSQQPYLTFNTEDFRLREDPTGPNELPMQDQFSYVLEAIKNETSTDEKATLTGNSYNNQESNQIELPDSPFASPPV